MSATPAFFAGVRPLIVTRYSAVSVLVMAMAAGALAQPASSTWDTTISFNGSGNLDMSNFGPPGNTDVDPLTVALTGSGITTANATLGGFSVSSSMNVFATVGIPSDGILLPAVSAPVTAPKTGPDPGLNLTAPTVVLPGNSSAPFYGLFPPGGGTIFGGAVSTSQSYLFAFNGSGGDDSYNINFDGAADFTLVGTPVETVSGNTYTFTYYNSILELNPSVGGNDPTVDFTGPLVITTTAAVAATPDGPPGLVGAAVLLAVCAAGAWRKSRGA